MSIQTAPDGKGDGKGKPESKPSWLDGTEAVWLPALLIALLVSFIVLTAISLFVYPLAWLLGFDPVRWWSKDPQMPEWFWGVTTITGFVLFVAGLVAVAAFWLMDFRSLLDGQ